MDFYIAQHRYDSREPVYTEINDDMTEQEIEWLADEILGYLLDGYELADIIANLTTGTEAGYREALLIVADAYCPARR